ncbi:ATP-binding cassette domain-containing protein [Streptomyces sp. SID8379]|uniref:ABC transporter ATP-binding protein n=1 Tax=unclassified Streptomyces TaxID=2593676 RepID=UPI000369F6E2|nr:MULTISPECIES: ABC transporter ATP-binding protein [unclassified Streptomyces]MYW69780.1 ATP-binding cassette domain-containing protein [Streptomyces sp. SID8379]
MRLLRRPRIAEPKISASEQELFGGPLRYDMGWSKHEYARLDLTLWGALKSLPHLVGRTVALAWRTDRRSLVTVGVTEVGQGIATAVKLLAVNAALHAVLAAGTDVRGLRHALPAGVMLVVINSVNAVLASWSTSAAGSLEPKVERAASEQYLAACERVEMAAIEDGEFRELIDRAQYGANEARHMIGSSVAAINSVLSLVASGGVLLSLNPVLLPMLVLIVAPRGWGVMRVAQQRYFSTMTWIEHLRASRVLSSLLTSVTAALEVRVHGVGAYLLRHFTTMSHTAESEQERLAKDKARTELAASALQGVGYLLTFTLMITLCLTGHMSVAVFGTATMALNSGSAGIGALVSTMSQLHEQSLYVHDLTEFLVKAQERAIPEGGLPLPERHRTIQLDHVSFRYPGRDEPAVKDVSFSIPLGSVIALVGPNGSGKSTLVRLLSGLHLPGEGQIRWDDVDVARADRRQLFGHVSLLTQTFERWPFTAAANIRIGDPERTPTEEELRASAVYAGADVDIAALPRGMNTLLGKQFRGGSDLSGGQWQKIGLARAHFRDACMIIVDEPTAALDPDAEQRAFDQILGLAGPDRIIVLVTHRMAAVRHVDRVFVMHEGHLIEQGSHAELFAVEPRSRYAQMYRLQAEQYDTTLPRPARPTAAESA